MELDEPAVVPASVDFHGGWGDVVGRREKVREFFKARGRAGREFVLVKAQGDAERFSREGVVVPSDGTDDAERAGGVSPVFEELPAEAFQATGEFFVIEEVA